jgi:Ca-activated chloride channel homolog
LTRADVPLNLPAGWDYDKVFGEQQPTLEREAMLDPTLIASTTTAPAAQSQDAARQLELPRTATPSELLMMIGALVMALALVLRFRARRMSAA